MSEYIIELPELGEITVDFETGPEFTIEATGVPGRQGDPGNPGQDGISPTVTVTDITGGHRITITDATGAHSFDVMDGDGGGVQDVQVNGTSVVQDGVANVPIGSSSNLGVVKANNAYGTALNAYGEMFTYAAPASNVKAGTNGFQPLVPGHQHEAAFYGMAKAAGDTTQSASSNAVGTYTDAAKKAIQHMIGVPETWEFINTVEISEDADRIVCQTDISGQPFTLKAAAMIIYSAVSSQVTGNASLKCGFSPYQTGFSTNYELVTMSAGIRTTPQQNVVWAKIMGIIPDKTSSTTSIADGTITFLESASAQAVASRFTITSGTAATDGYIHNVYVDGKYFGPGSFIRVWGIRA